MAGAEEEEGTTDSPLQSLLSVWIERASARLDIALDLFAPAADIVRDLWIQWHLPYDDDIDILDVEAMEMLELYARVDYEAAWRLIFKTGYRKCFADMVVDEAKYPPKTRVYPRFILHNTEHRHHQNGGFQRLVQWLMHPVDPSDHSESYCTTRDELLKRIGDLNRQKPFQRSSSERIPFKFRFNIRAADSHFRSLIEYVAEAAAISEDPRRRHHVSQGSVAKPSCPVFVLDAVVPKWDEGTVTNETLRSFQAISTSWGGCIEHVPLASASFSAGTLSPQVLNEFLRATLLPVDAIRPATSTTLTNKISIEALQAACSALLVSPSIKTLKTVQLGAEPVIHHLWWVWLAYAAFSREAVNNITELELDLEVFTDEDMNLVEKVLDAQDPLQYATVSIDEKKSKDLKRQPFVVDVRPHSALLVQADSSTKRLVKIKTSDSVETLRVVDDAPGNYFVCVLYPGVGICNVDRDCIIASRPLPASSTRSSHNIERLSLHMEETTSLDALVRLVQLLGPGLQKLTVKCIMDDRLVPNSFLERLLAACPDLSRLELVRVQFADFQWLPPGGPHSLAVDSIDTTDPAAYEQLLRDIASRRINFTNLHIQNPAGLFDELEETMFNMLESNDTLERFFISPDTADYREGAEIEVPEQGEELEKRHGALLKRPCPLRSKLAFISGMRESDDGFSGHLDASLMAMIFQYAAPRVTRVCSAFPIVE